MSIVLVPSLHPAGQWSQYGFCLSLGASELNCGEVTPLEITFCCVEVDIDRLKSATSLRLKLSISPNYGQSSAFASRQDSCCWTKISSKMRKVSTLGSSLHIISWEIEIQIMFSTFECSTCQSLDPDWQIPGVYPELSPSHLDLSSKI